MEANRSRFVLEAVRHELERRRREQLRLSLTNPHPDSSEVAEDGPSEWLSGLPAEQDDLILPGALKPLRWTSGAGWQME
jgi:hypothetical protein